MTSKYAALPDLVSLPLYPYLVGENFATKWFDLQDASQDVYETPDLAEDVSTLPTSVSAALSASEEEDEEDEEGYLSRISHDHLRPSDARNRFRNSEIDARGVDFSDRISGKRKSYRASSRRRRRRVGGGYDLDEEEQSEYGDFEEDYGEESLERRLARLRKEVEVLKGEIANRDEVERRREEEEINQAGDDGEGGGEKERDLMLGIDDLSDVLEGLQTISGEERGAQAKLAKKLATSLAVAAAPKTAGQAVSEKGSPEGAMVTMAATGEPTATYTVTYSPAYKKSHALAKAADFDNRLTVIEKVLGISSSAIVNIDKQLPTSAMIPTLDELMRQVSVLTTSSTSSLDASSRKVKQLTLEAEKLAEARRAAKAAADLRREDGDQAAQGATHADSSERDAKINALYGTLPTIESLRPLLPAVLDRLRSLRTIHADAARAMGDLKKVEKRQEEIDGEISRWREALEKVENIVKASEKTVEGNMGTVEGWVKELEERALAVAKITQDRLG